MKLNNIMTTLYVPVVARIASRALGDGLDLKWEKDVVGAAPLADVAQVMAVLVGITGYV